MTGPAGGRAFEPDVGLAGADRVLVLAVLRARRHAGVVAVGRRAVADRVISADPLEAEALDLLKGWDGIVSADSGAAVVAGSRRAGRS